MLQGVKEPIAIVDTGIVVKNVHTPLNTSETIFAGDSDPKIYT